MLYHANGKSTLNGVLSWTRMVLYEFLSPLKLHQTKYFTLLKPGTLRFCHALVYNAFLYTLPPTNRGHSCLLHGQNAASTILGMDSDGLGLTAHETVQQFPRARYRHNGILRPGCRVRTRGTGPFWGASKTEKDH